VNNIKILKRILLDFVNGFVGICAMSFIPLLIYRTLTQPLIGPRYLLILPFVLLCLAVGQFVTIYWPGVERPDEVRKQLLRDIHWWFKTEMCSGNGLSEVGCPGSDSDECKGSTCQIYELRCRLAKELNRKN
jgi:hypothetical protein